MSLPRISSQSPINIPAQLKCLVCSNVYDIHKMVFNRSLAHYVCDECDQNRRPRRRLNPPENPTNNPHENPAIPIADVLSIDPVFV